MPELPEVETIRRDIAHAFTGKRIRRLVVRKPSLLKGSRADFRRALKSAQVVRVARRAKHLIVELSTGYAIIIHLKMTGQLVMRALSGKLTVGGHPITGVSSVPNRFTYVTLEFTNGWKLYFNDVRRFGYWRVIRQVELAQALSHLGPEPLSKSFTPLVFKQALARRKRTSIKAAILDQTIIAGIGNIYADEVLYAARIKPSRRTSQLKQVEVVSLYRAIRAVLRRAVAARGTSFNTYVDGLGREGTYWEKRLAYGRAGEGCKRCGSLFKKTVVAQRGTTYCPSCQR